MKHVSNMIRLFNMLGKARFKLFIAAFFGVCGHIAAFSIPVLGVVSIVLNRNLVLPLIACALVRGLFRYIEQALNHDVAFRILAQIRRQIFETLRVLVPGNYDGFGYGNLMTLITSDIELLEVFFAHTVSPILIALVFNGGVVVLLYQFHPLIALLALVVFVFLGMIVPMIISQKGYTYGARVRHDSSVLHNTILETVFGFIDVTQYRLWSLVFGSITSHQKTLSSLSESLNHVNEVNRFILECGILSSFVAVLGLGSWLGLPPMHSVLAATILISSFGPIVSLSNLSGNLHHTFASARRVLALMDTEPSFVDVLDGEDVPYNALSMKACDLGYQDTVVLKDFDLAVGKTGIVGIKGASGFGKTTIFKTLMQLIPPLKGEIQWSNQPISTVNTHYLRKEFGYMEQETTIFRDTVANNIRIGKWDANKSDIIDAAQKANIHAFIMTLPDGYDTLINNSLSSGERQRIALARMFLHNGSLWLLDEPTSNLDSLNEAAIMQSIIALKDEKAMILSSHRKSTLSGADRIIDIEK